MKVKRKLDNLENNKGKNKHFENRSKKTIKTIFISLVVCLLAVGSYMYFFAIGWKVDSDNMNIDYFYENGSIQFEFELTNGRVLNSWCDRTDGKEKIIKLTECYSSFLDDRGENPGKFSYGIEVIGENGNLGEFKDDDKLILKFKDKEKKYDLSEILEKLAMQ